MNRTLWLVIGGILTVVVVAIIIPWRFANERYKVRLAVQVDWNGTALHPLACLNGAGSPIPFPGLELILPGDHPRLRLLRAHDGRLGEVALDRSGRVERLPPGACVAEAFEVRGNGHTGYNVEGVEGVVDVRCAHGPNTFTVKGTFANCYRPD